MMSMSGITERTKISGMLRFIFRGLAEALPRRYANAMCPTANEVLCLLKSQTFSRRAIKRIGLESRLGVRQLQRCLAAGWAGDTVFCNWLLLVVFSCFWLFFAGGFLGVLWLGG